MADAPSALRQLVRDIDRLSLSVRLLIAFAAVAFLVLIPLEVWLLR